MKKQWLLLLVGAFGCLFTAVNPLSAQIWSLTSAPTNAWSSVASSADGSKLVAAVKGGGIYTSTNSGATWTLTSADNAGWTGVVSSADGTKLAAISADYNVYISTNSGATWNNRTEGMVFPALPEFDYPYGFAVCLSADGTKLVVVENIYDFVFATFDYGLIFTSTNSGATWTQTSAFNNSWSAVASSVDGSKLAATVYGGGIYTSTNSGAAWTLTSAPVLSWTSVASSADGARLLAASADSIYTSTDSGVTWTQGTNAPSGAAWSSVASSTDGSKLVAVLNGGGIYTCQTTPAPVMNVTMSNGNLGLSWIVPATSFVLQQNSDLCTANWTDVTNTPALNLTNLQNQVFLSPSTGSGFYRLKTP